jgi:hypothetical protein
MKKGWRPAFCIESFAWPLMAREKSWRYTIGIALRLPSHTAMRLLAVTAIFFSGTLMLSAAENQFESGPQQISLVELYTSEGCSSCPPAEAWLSRLKDNPGLWKQFVPIAFHVDYWDRLGWRDRFSSRQWTERQSRYAALWHADSVYTPAVVVNGREQRGWSVANLSQPNEKSAGVLQVAGSDGKTFAIEFRPTNGTAGDWDVHLALLGSGISSRIGAGENSGRNLQHDFVVLGLRDATMQGDGEVRHASLTISAASEVGARLAVAIWVSARDRLAPIQATGGWLP